MYLILCLVFHCQMSAHTYCNTLSITISVNIVVVFLLYAINEFMLFCNITLVYVYVSDKNATLPLFFYNSEKWAHFNNVWYRQS